MTFGARQLCGAWVSVCSKSFPSTLFPKYAANSGTHEHTAFFAQNNRRYRRCGIPVRSASFEFAAYFRFLPLWQAVLL